MLKHELEIKLKDVESELIELKKNVKDALQTVADNSCEDSHEYIRDFCDHTRIESPTAKQNVSFVDVEMPLGIDEDDVKITVNGKIVEFDYVDLNA